MKKENKIVMYDNPTNFHAYVSLCFSEGWTVVPTTLIVHNSVYTVVLERDKQETLPSPASARPCACQTT